MLRPFLISWQVFVLARNRYNSGSSLYFVRGGSEIISSDDVQNGKSPRSASISRIYTFPIYLKFEPSQDAEVVPG